MREIIVDGGWITDVVVFPCGKKAPEEPVCEGAGCGRNPHATLASVLLSDRCAELEVECRDSWRRQGTTFQTAADANLHAVASVASALSVRMNHSPLTGTNLLQHSIGAL